MGGSNRRGLRSGVLAFLRRSASHPAGVALAGSFMKFFKALAVGSLAAGLALSFGSSAAAAPSLPTAEDTGLYGSQDPTFDGVFRQGLAISGLVAADRKVSQSSVSWLLNQQCSDGSFQAYRTDTEEECSVPDPETFTGPDTNSTALAAMALRATGESKASKSAVAWLRDAQNDADGGFPFIKGGDSDANSTGLALAAIRGAQSSSKNKDVLKRGQKHLKGLMLRCSSPKDQRGLLSFQSDPKVLNELASAQGALGLLTSLPSSPTSVSTKGGAIKCSNGKTTKKPKLTAALLAGLKKQLKKNNWLLPSSFGSGPDISASSYAVLAMTSAERYGKKVKKVLKQIKNNAADFTQTDGAPNAGALGTLLLVSAATDSNPRSFGGVDLVSVLKGSVQ